MNSTLPFLYMFYFTIGFGSLVSISSLHWVIMWAGLEVNLIGFLPILAYQSKISETESSVKYFIVQALGSSLLILGSVYLYSSFYTWDISVPGKNSAFYFFIVVGLLIKLGLFPFHYWLPSVMAGLPWFSCLLLATWQKLAPLFLLSTLLQSCILDSVILLVCLFCVGSSILGGLGGINQTQIRALIAYSSIGHLGWLVFGAIHSSWVMKVYFIFYVFITFSLFISFLGSNANNMKDLDSMVDHIYVKIMTMIILLSLGGLPPLLGFIPKVAIISSCGWGWSTVNYLMFIIISGSVISLFYYLHLFYIVVMSSIVKDKLLAISHYLDSFLLSVLVIFNLMGGVTFIMVTCLMH